MDLGIRDRVAVVTASSRGLGRAVAEALAAEGCRLAVGSRDAAAAARAGREIADRFGVATFSTAVEATDEDSVKGFVDAARAELGPISIAVANCGGPPAGRFEDFSGSDWRRAYELSFLSTRHLIAAVLPDMKSAGWGRVVSITSVAVKQPIDGLILSNGVRAGVVGLMKSLAAEYGRWNILFNNLGPGLTSTERLLALADRRASEAGKTRAEIVAEMSAETAVGRVGRPEEFGAVAAFLCSEQAGYVTGQSLMVDGGLWRGV